MRDGVIVREGIDLEVVYPAAIDYKQIWESRARRMIRVWGWRYMMNGIGMK